MKTVLMATERGGKEVMLAGPEVSIGQQSDQLQSLFHSGSNEYSSVRIDYLTPCRAAVELKPSVEIENKKPKSKMKLFALLIFAFAMVANAAPNLQDDGRLNGGTNVCLSAVTNIYRGTGTVFDASKADAIMFEFSFTCTNANGMTAGAGPTITLDGGLNGSNSDLWVTNALGFVATGAGGTNVTITNLTAAQRYPFYRVGTWGNTNLSGTNYSALKVRCFTVTSQ